MERQLPEARDQARDVLWWDGVGGMQRWPAGGLRSSLSSHPHLLSHPVGVTAGASANSHTEQEGGGLRAGAQDERTASKHDMDSSYIARKLATTVGENKRTALGLPSGTSG